MLECKIECLGPHRGRLPWVTQQMTNDGWSFALPITVEKSVSNGFCSTIYNSCFQFQVSYFYSWVDFHRNHLQD